MKTPYKNIYKVLDQNRFIVWSMVIGTTVTCVVAILSMLKLHRETVDKVFMVNTDGDVIPLKLVSQKENLGVEVLSHLELFHTYFYNIDPSNYEKNLEKALWLGNSSVDALYRQKKSDGVYNRLLQYSLVQKVLRIESEIEISQEPYTFRTTTLFQINRGQVTDTYELVTSGNLIHVDRNFPKNTHGLLITDYFENSLKKVQDEN
ncbi:MULTISPECIES: conjugal transfer protein TraK [unclassified Arenibacter]|uniref:conjugal transfer protein TraK n=1 Tax=unclassified Arenibacter TaxID=2615047 RepID=UPI000E34E954|nr:MULTISPECIES: conjugal transfer protein TraK [unclassified Arenibacter]MCM4164859.1 conjugal transfer protein TraK [Arenibacter sp. A80]RFT55275.1 conjugal transfer protein TraK [Arenibacter sp. P308M17]